MNSFKQINLFGLDWCKTSVRTLLKSTNQSTKMCATCACVALVALSTIVQSCRGKSEYHFANTEDAISQYQSFCSDLRMTDATSIDELARNICHWQEFSDTVFRYICATPEFDTDTTLALRFCTITDSIRSNISRLALKEDRSYQDILTLKVQTCPYRNDTALIRSKANAEQFFKHLDATKPRQTTLPQALSNYRTFLSGIQQNGIRDREDFFHFLREEDVHFRIFLCHLSKCGDISLADITDGTETVCRMVFEAANRGELDDEEVITYMAMRTNRRMVQNAQVCIKALQDNAVKGENQLAAYQWMTLQPFVTISGISLALLTEDEQAQLRNIANSISLLTRDPKYTNATGLLSNQELPNQILKLYISTL
mgnify:FL=1